MLACVNVHVLPLHNITDLHSKINLIDALSNKQHEHKV